MKKFSEITEAYNSRHLASAVNSGFRGTHHSFKTPRQSAAESKANRPTARERYDHHKKEALAHLEVLRKQLEGDPGDKINWGHVGSMEEAHHQLRRLAKSGHASS